MSKQLMDVVLPRLARPLHQQLERYRAGELTDAQFNQSFAALVRRHHRWLARRGVSEVHAALAIHGALLVLSGPGMRVEAAEARLPLEVIEFHAVREAAADVARNYPINEGHAIRVIAGIVARYGV
jgi:hypothetical protein